MPDLPTKRLFVSYSHEDDKEGKDVLAAKVFKHVSGLKHSLEDMVTLEVFIDKDRLDAGDQWRAVIMRWLDEADVALLLLSPSFIASDFIMKQELPRLRERWQAGRTRLIPLRLHACSHIRWLTETEFRPRSGRWLAEIFAEAGGPASVDRHLGELMDESKGCSGRARGR